MPLSGKTALITGGGTGIGKAVAKHFRQAGCTVIISGRREEKLRETAEQIGLSSEMKYRATDMSDRAQVNDLISWCHKEFGDIDILVANAGVNVVERRLENITAENWDYIMNVNSTGAFNIMHAVLEPMRQRKDGLIISISSIAGIRPSELGGAAYSAAKAGMDALTKVIGLEERHHGIRTCVISPGEVDTPILEQRPVPVSDDHRSRILQPDDVARAAVFVASLPSRASVPTLVIKPTSQEFV